MPVPKRQRVDTGVTPRNYIARYKTFTDVPFFSNFAPQENGA
ncbi:MAG: hypothetical protein SPG83_03655 [Intestinimonas sp.]|nr:hypothetical protein [Intestinimonas sp.]MDY5338625.1 hypothetical protein [Intestinimonas sp.]